ncbi:MAG: GntR family transcriptional regulator [Solobacterium sp.]|nr:GntR family transcriptional regulator [Solobacterium sp.]MBR0213935.1 GntR family transcriptional regulator [Solobacterium sp.]
MNRLQETTMITGEEIYRDLLKKITELEYMPGDALSENELCAAYKCSRHMVRDAFSKLKEKGLLEVYPHRGSYVSLIDLKQIEDILFLREAVETAAVSAIIRETDPGDLPELLAGAIEEQKTASAGAEADLPAYFRADDRFHGILLEKAGRASLYRLLEDEYIHLRRWRNLEIRTTRRIPALIQEHEAIRDAVLHRDAAEASVLLHRHFDTLKFAASVDEGRDNSYFYKNHTEGERK